MGLRRQHCSQVGPPAEEASHQEGEREGRQQHRHPGSSGPATTHGSKGWVAVGACGVCITMAAQGCVPMRAHPTGAMPPQLGTQQWDPPGSSAGQSPLLPGG